MQTSQYKIFFIFEEDGMSGKIVAIALRSPGASWEKQKNGNEAGKEVA
jgi:hypothetical protein